MRIRQQNARSGWISCHQTRPKVSPTMETREIHWFYDESIAKSKGAHPSSKWDQAKIEKVSLGALLHFKQSRIPMIHHEVPHQEQNEPQEGVQQPQRILLEHVPYHDDA